MRSRICITADIHFERVLREENGYENMVDYFCKSLNYIKPDMFVIAGDLTDSRNLRLETPEAGKLAEFVKIILDITSKNNIEVIFLKGTPSHDGDILKNLSFITDRYRNFTYVEDLSRQTIRGMDIVFIPELYRPTYTDFNTELTNVVTPNNKCDIIFFHGMFDFAISAVKQIDSKHNMSRTVVMNSSQISKMCNIAIGGHVHSFMHENNIWYVGRFINERGHNYMNDIYGMKYVVIDENNNYDIKNVDNDYLIKQDLSYVNLIKYTIDSDNVRRACAPYVNRMKDVIFYVKMNNTPEVKDAFKKWKETYKPMYVKKDMETVSNVIEIDGVNSVIDNRTELGVMDFRNLLSTIYKDQYGEELSKDIIDMIEMGDDYES